VDCFRVPTIQELSGRKRIPCPTPSDNPVPRLLHQGQDDTIAVSIPMTPPSTIAHYKIIAKLGEGGMGEVWRATDTKLNREVAIKILPERFAQDADRMARFTREAQVLASLNHPNIAAIYGVEERALVMEVVEGRTLAERIAAGTIPIDEALPIAKQIAEALEYAHEHGIIHRDLKPANLKITPEGTVKVLDFGLAKALTGEAASSSMEDSPTLTYMATQTGILLGTPAYMSPEQAGAKSTDRRTDIWSFGALFYEMLTRRRAFGGATTSDVLAAVIRSEPDWAALPEGTPLRIGELLRRCLRKDPKQRLQAIGDARIEINEVLNNSDEREALPASMIKRRFPGLGWVAVMGILLVAAAGAGWWTGQRNRNRTLQGGISFQQKTFLPAQIGSTRFAPDGRSIVYQASLRAGESDLYMLRPEYPQAQAMGLHGALAFSISSKGELAVVTNRSHYYTSRSGTLGKMPLGGELPRPVLENVRAVDWSPDGLTMAVVHAVDGRDVIEYPLGKVRYRSSGVLSDLRVSPKGDEIAFLEHPLAGDSRGWVAMLDRAGNKRTLSEEYFGEFGLAWSPQGDEIYYSAGDSPVLKVFGVTPSGRPRVVLQGAGGLIVTDVSQDGRLLVVRSDVRSGIVALAPKTRVERDLSWLSSSWAPFLSADGRTILFTEEGGNGGLTYALCIRGTDGSAVVRLGEGLAQGLSPDRKWALSIVPTEPPKLMLYPTGPGEPREVKHGDLQLLQTAQWFPDGKRLLVCGSEPGRPTRCYIMDVSGDNRRAAGPEGITSAWLAPDGSTVFGSDGSGRYFLFQAGGGAPVREVSTVPADYTMGDWSGDSYSILIYQKRQVPSRLERLDLATGTRTLVKLLAPSDPAGVSAIGSVSVTDSGSTYAFSYVRWIQYIFVVSGVQ
jgi:serine/threonine protein kinase